MFGKLFKRRETKPSLRRKIVLALGSIAATLLLSSVISILEYRRMSDYVSELIASNIKSINLSQSLADLTQEYNHQMIAVVVQNDISIMPDFNMDVFTALSDSLRSSLTSDSILPLVDSLEVSFNDLDDIKKSSKTASSVWVPARNMVFTSIAVSYAESIGAEKIIVGWDAEEAATFPDNSKEFLERYLLVKIIKLIFAASDGCIPKGPIPNQLRLPFLTIPIPGIATKIKVIARRQEIIFLNMIFPYLHNP